MLILFAVLALISFALVLTLNPLNHRPVVRRPAAGGLLSLHEALHSHPAAGARDGVLLVHSHGLCGPGQCPAAQDWLLFLANLLWTIAYDTQYAMVDRDDDLKLGLNFISYF